MNNAQRTLAIASGVALIAMIGVSQAAQPTFYAGGDIVRMKTKIDDKTGVPPIVTGTATATTLRLKGGAHFLDWLDAELHVVLPKSETFSTVGDTNTVKTSIVGLFAKPNIDAGPVNIYGLVGFARAKYDVSGVIDGSETASGLAYGAGVQYKFAKNISGSIDYTQYRKKNFAIAGFTGGADASASIIGVGVTYKFK